MALPKFINRNGSLYVDFAVTPSIRFRKSINEHCDLANWDKKKERSKTDHLLNRVIEKINSALIESKRELFLANNLNEPNFIKMFEKKVNMSDQVKLIDYFQGYGKQKNYVGNINAITTLLKEMPPIGVNDVSRLWFQNFKKTLLNKGLSESTAKNYYTILMGCLKQAYEQDEILNTDPKKFRIKFKRSNVLHVRYYQEEIDQIWSSPLVGYLDFVRDQFLIGCLTGARYNMYSIIDQRFIQKDILKYQPMKNAGYNVRLPLNQRLRELLSRIKSKRIDHQSVSYKGAYDKFLATLPQMIKACEVDTTVMIRKEQFLKADLTKTHTAKRTFACIQHEQGMPLNQLKQYLCHGSVQTTQRYLDATA